MGMSSVLGSALSGLRVTQAGLELVSRNVSNADLPGYTKKVMGQTPLLAGDSIVGVKAGEVNRQLDTFILRQMWRETSGAGYINTMSRYLSHVDTMLGAPGSPAGMDSLYNAFLGSLEALTASPESFTARDQFLRDAQALAQSLNQTSGDLQALRLEAERGIGEAVDRINQLLTQISKLNKDIAARSGSGAQPADLLDIRDRHISELSQLIDLRVVERGNGEVALSTTSGAMLLDLEPAQLIFDGRGAMTPQSLYGNGESERGVGTIRLKSADGQVIDLIQDRAIRSGELAALIELRDKHLVQAQAQLDAFADAMARALSANPVASEAIPDGREIDAAGMRSGDRMVLTYLVNGEERRVTIIRVEDPASLPLSNDATADPGDTVIGVSFSGGWAAVAAALQAELPDIVVGEDGGKLQFLDGANSEIGSLSASVTATAFDAGLGLPLFLDGNAPYSASLDGRPQQLGFAGRITINPALFTDNSLLVRYRDGTAAGDPTRPLEMLRRLTLEQQHFAAPGASGSTAYSGTVGGFLQRVISFQAAQHADALRAKEAQDVVVAHLEERFTRESGVNIDEEMARLIELQTAFQANTRVVQAYREMMAMLMQL